MRQTRKLSCPSDTKVAHCIAQTKVELPSNFRVCVE